MLDFIRVIQPPAMCTRITCRVAMTPITSLVRGLGWTIGAARHGSCTAACYRPNYPTTYHLHHSPRLVMVFPPRCYATLLRSPSTTRECRSLPTFFTNYSWKAQRICRDMGVVWCSNIPPDAWSALAPVTSRRTGRERVEKLRKQNC